MKHKMKQIIKVSATALSLAGVVVAIGFGCGLGFQPLGFEGSGSNGFSSFGGASDVGDNADLSIISGTKTVAVTNYNAVLDNIISMTGVQPSNNTRNAYNNNLGSFSESGSVLSVNAPMLFAYLTVGSEACNDLVNSENSIGNIEDRRFFRFNLGGNAGVITDEVISDMTRRLARSFWQRNETNQELQLIATGVQEMLQGPQQNNSGSLANKAALFTCSAMLASLASYEI